MLLAGALDFHSLCLRLECYPYDLSLCDLSRMFNLSTVQGMQAVNLNASKCFYLLSSDVLQDYSTVVAAWAFLVWETCLTFQDEVHLTVSGFQLPHYCYWLRFF